MQCRIFMGGFDAFPALVLYVKMQSDIIVNIPILPDIIVPIPAAPFINMFICEMRELFIE